VTVVLRGELVTLRALRPDEVDLFWRSRGGKLTRERCLERIERSGKLTEGKLDLGIDVEGRLVGDVGARRPRDFYPPGVYELGIDIFHPDDRGHGYGREAIALLTGHLFGDEGIAERVQGSTAVGNGPMRRVFELLGFQFEGVLRGLMPGPDGREDYALYAVLKDEWPHVTNSRRHGPAPT
jgi:RimJ/RimL family protein N-acetyltransferase